MGDIKKGTEGSIPSHKHNVDGSRVLEKVKENQLYQKLCQGVMSQFLFFYFLQFGLIRSVSNVNKELKYFLPFIC